MPIIPNTFQAAIELNNSFSILPSGSRDGEFFSIEKGRLFSETGFENGSFVFESERELRRANQFDDECFLKISLEPRTLYATGVKVLPHYFDVVTALESEDEIVFFTKSFYKENKSNLVDGDIFFLNDSSFDKDAFANGFLEKDEDGNFYLQLRFREDLYEIYEDDGSAPVDLNKSVKINFGRESGQKIFCLRGEFLAEKVKVFKNEPLMDSFRFSSQEGHFLGREDNGVLDPSTSFSFLIPCFLIDFEKESVVDIKPNNAFHLNPNTMGINNNFFADYA